MEAPIKKVFISDFVNGKRTSKRPKNSLRKAVDRDSIAFDSSNWETEASDRANFRRR